MNPWSISAPLDKFMLGSVWVIRKRQSRTQRSAGPEDALDLVCISSAEERNKRTTKSCTSHFLVYMMKSYLSTQFLREVNYLSSYVSYLYVFVVFLDVWHGEAFGEITTNGWEG